MDFKFIAAGMLIILGGLLIWVKFYSPKEKLKTQAERDYYQSVLKYKKNTSEYDRLISHAKQLGVLKNISSKQLKIMVENDTKQVVDINVFN